MSKMKVMNVSDEDFDAYNDWLVGDAARRFGLEGYTHVCDGGSLIKCEYLGPDLVCVGESVYQEPST